MLGALAITIPRLFVHTGTLSLFLSIASLALVLIAVTIIFQEFFSYNEFIDKLFPVATAENIVATFKPAVERRATIVVCAHHDSAREFRLIYKFKGLYVLFVLVAFLVLFLMLIVTSLNMAGDILLLFGMIAHDSWLFTSNAVLATILALTPVAAFMFVFTGDDVVPGGRDDLAGCVTVLGTARFIAKHRPRFVEVKVATLDSEEAGLRGSKRFIAMHREELAGNGFILNSDSIGNHGIVTVVSHESTTRTKHDAKWVEFIANASRRIGIQGIDVVVKGDPFGGGGTDAVSFTRAGIPATTIHMYMPLRYHLEKYHTRYDDASFVEPCAIQDAVDIAIAVIRDLDDRCSDEKE
ncbi:MAG: M28 family metallopeptidase [Candidatus Sigynarchaeota archaeon]